MATVSAIAGEIDDCKYGDYPVHSFDDVGAGLAKHNNQDGGLAVG
jgi:hypothetical protein